MDMRTDLIAVPLAGLGLKNLRKRGEKKTLGNEAS